MGTNGHGSVVVQLDGQPDNVLVAREKQGILKEVRVDLKNASLLVRYGQPPLCIHVLNYTLKCTTMSI